MLGNFGKMMKMAAEMKTRLPEMQQRLAESEYTAESGGGAVSATVSGKMQLTELKIAPDVLDDEAMDAEMLADVIKAAGPHGESYLTNDHTMKWLHSDEYVQPRLSVVGPRATWEAQGSKDTYQLARDKVREYATCKSEPLAPEIHAKLDEIIADF